MQVERRSFFQSAAALAFGDAGAVRNGTSPEGGQPRVVADPYVRFARSPHDWSAPPWVGAPTIVRTGSGLLLASYTYFGEGSPMQTTFLVASADNGKTWRGVAEVSPLFWPSLFRTSSGLYLIGVDRPYEAGDNRLLIFRSGDDGRTWSKPSALTTGLRVHTGNTGVLISKGRITRAIEVAPALSPAMPQTRTAAEFAVTGTDLNVRELALPVENAAFLPHLLLAVSAANQKLHCRVMRADPERRVLTVRPESWPNQANTPGPWRFPKGADVRIATHLPDSNRDFLSMVLDASETADLCDPAAWRKSNLVVNPAYTYATAAKELFGLDFTRKGAGWLEGVLLRLEHPGGSGKIVNLLRVQNEKTADISARIEVDDSGEELRCRFDRFAPAPGLGIAHCSATYDARSRLYWMASNVARDTTRDTSKTRLRMPATQERSNLGLFYSANSVDWFMAGLVAYAPDWVHSYHYPNLMVDGEDVIVVVRSHVESPLTEQTVGPKTANRHDSNAATFHRVRNFRGLANLEFIRYRTT